MKVCLAHAQDDPDPPRSRSEFLERLGQREKVTLREASAVTVRRGAKAGDRTRASAAFEFLLQTRTCETISAEMSLVTEVHAPHLLDIELASSLRRCVALGTIAGEAFDDLRAMRVHRYRHMPLLARIWDFAITFPHTTLVILRWRRPWTRR